MTRETLETLVKLLTRLDKRRTELAKIESYVDQNGENALLVFLIPNEEPIVITYIKAYDAAVHSIETEIAYLKEEMEKLGFDWSIMNE